MSPPHPAASQVTVERIASLDELLARRREWDRLQNACPSKHVLLDHRWVSAWWRRFGGAKELHVLLLRRAERAVGVVPMILSRGFEAFPAKDSRMEIADDYAHERVARWRRLTPVRRVTFPLNIASHNARSHFLFEEDAPDLYEAVFRYWKERASRWDLMVLEGIPLASPQPDLIREACRKASLWTLRWGKTMELYHAELRGSLDAFLKTRTRHFRKRRKAQLRAISQRGKIGFREYRGAELDAGLEVLFAIERRTWKATYDPDRRVNLSLDDTIRAFFSDVAHGFAGTDDAVVLVMTVDDRPAGALFGVSREGVILSVVIYLDDSYRESITGLPLHDAFLERSATRGFDRIDYNGMTVMAKKWSNGSEVYRRIYICHPGLYSRLLGSAKTVATGLSRAVRAVGRPVRTGYKEGRWED